MKEFKIGQVFKLKEDLFINIDNEDVCTSKLYFIRKDTNFTIKNYDDGFFDLYFSDYGIGVFTYEELLSII